MTTKTLQISYPDPASVITSIQKNLTRQIKKAKRSFIAFSINLADNVSSSVDNLTSSSLKSKSKFNFPKFKKINFKQFVPTLIVFVSAGITVWWFSSLLNKPITAPVTSQSTKASVLGARAKVDIGREFLFPVKDNTGKKELTKLKFVVDSAEIRDEIIVNSKRATAIEGRTFLIVNLKITSEYTKGLNINTRDYFRLTVNGKESDLLAPEIHSDPVSVQPISTKLTRFGFPINSTDANLVLVVGEIQGEKTKLDLNLQ